MFLSDAETRILEKGLDYAPIKRKINEPELRHKFNDFCRRMYLKWYFWDEPDRFSETPCLEVFLSQVEAELFKMSTSSIRYSNILKGKWDAIRYLADERNIAIKKSI